MATDSEELTRLLNLLIGDEPEKYMDVGSGERSGTWEIRCKSRLDVDGSFLLVKDHQRMPFLYIDALRLGEFLKPKQFDLITCLDVIEHQMADDGLKLISVLEELGRGRIVFLTPVGGWCVGDNGRKYHDHLSGWYPKDFAELGYSCLVFPRFHGSVTIDSNIESVGAFYAVKDLARPFDVFLFESNKEFLYNNYWVLPKG